MTTFLGNPVTLEGTRLSAGEEMPNFTVTTTDLTDIQPMEKRGKRSF